VPITEDRWQGGGGGSRDPAPQRSSVFDRLSGGARGGGGPGRGRGAGPGGAHPPALGQRSGSGGGAPTPWARAAGAAPREGPGFLDRDGARGARARRPSGDGPGRDAAGEGGAALTRSRSDGSQPSRKRVFSAVVVDGELRVPSGTADGGGGGGSGSQRRRSSSGAGDGPEEGEAPEDGGAGAAAADEGAPEERPAKRQARPEDVKRSRRLFGSLLMGTLQRFK
jgi:hypothetical protein